MLNNLRTHRAPENNVHLKWHVSGVCSQRCAYKSTFTLLYLHNIYIYNLSGGIRKKIICRQQNEVAEGLKTCNFGRSQLSFLFYIFLLYIFLLFYYLLLFILFYYLFYFIFLITFFVIKLVKLCLLYFHYFLLIFLPC